MSDPVYKVVRLTRVEDESGRESRHLVVRAKGGHMHHALRQGEYTSLCGHTPKSNAHRMKPRAGWWNLGPGRLVTCGKCIAVESAEIKKENQ